MSIKKVLAGLVMPVLCTVALTTHAGNACDSLKGEWHGHLKRHDGSVLKAAKLSIDGDTDNKYAVLHYLDSKGKEHTSNRMRGYCSESGKAYFHSNRLISDEILRMHPHSANQIHIDYQSSHIFSGPNEQAGGKLIKY